MREIIPHLNSPPRGAGMPLPVPATDKRLCARNSTGHQGEPRPAPAPPQPQPRPRPRPRPPPPYPCPWMMADRVSWTARTLATPSFRIRALRSTVLCMHLPRWGLEADGDRCGRFRAGAHLSATVLMMRRWAKSSQQEGSIIL